MRTRILVMVLFVGSVVPSCYAQQGAEKLFTMSVEELLNIQVTSVSKTEQKLSQTASAIYVITQEDIERSGATNIPDLLRLAPGMDVGQINSNSSAISARGFNGRFSNGLLVMLDGQTVYTPTFGGVWWDVLDLPLEDTIARRPMRKEALLSIPPNCGRTPLLRAVLGCFRLFCRTDYCPCRALLYAAGYWLHLASRRQALFRPLWPESAEERTP